jgi:GH25 family lysozyme M1 (1,4-beta-N-acetylmuramidase)
MLRINPKFVDLSHYDDVQDGFAGAVKFGIRGVINKLTENTSVLDKSAHWRIGPAKAAGLLFGVYHFIRPGRIAEQAAWFLKNLAELSAAAGAAEVITDVNAPLPGMGLRGTGLRLVLDHETAGVSLADVRAWLERVHGATGQWPWLYSYSSFLCDQFVKEGGIDGPFWKQIGLWIAAYNDHPHCRRAGTSRSPGNTPATATARSPTTSPASSSPGLRASTSTRSTGPTTSSAARGWPRAPQPLR